MRWPNIEQLHFLMVLGQSLGPAALERAIADLEEFGNFQKRVRTMISEQRFNEISLLVEREEVAELKEAVRGADPCLLVAPYFSTAYLLPIILALSGVPVAFFHERMSPDYCASLRAAGVDLICAERGSGGARAILSEARAALGRGRLLSLVYDAPHLGGWPVRFFGQAFQVSNLPLLLAGKFSLNVQALALSRRKDDYLALSVGPFIRAKCEEEQRMFQERAYPILFRFLEDLVRVLPHQYRWNTHGIVCTAQEYELRAACALSQWVALHRPAAAQVS